MLRQDEALYDADSLLDLQQSKHTIQVLPAVLPAINVKYISILLEVVSEGFLLVGQFRVMKY